MHAQGTFMIPGTSHNPGVGDMLSMGVDNRVSVHAKWNVLI